MDKLKGEKSPALSHFPEWTGQEGSKGLRGTAFPQLPKRKKHPQTTKKYEKEDNKGPSENS